MSNYKCFELRQLTESIVLLRNYMKKYSKSSYQYTVLTKKYNELCKKRDLLEDEILKT